MAVGLVIGHARRLLTVAMCRNDVPQPCAETMLTDKTTRDVETIE
jgi:hypothetical protein